MDVNIDDVFGVSRDLPLNYIDRKGVDDEFVNRLARDQHIVIYGSSKQGKTSLRKKWLNDDDYIVVSSHNRWKLSDLHSAILKEAGYVTRRSSTQTISGEAKLVVSAEGELRIPFLSKAKAGAEGSAGATVTNSETVAEMELDPSDANDVIRALEAIEFSKFVVIEDFHYLPEDSQREFSFALKTFHENSKTTFVVVGVWREQNRLIGYNGDLTERVYSIDVDYWSKEDLFRVIHEGENILNIKFDDEFIQKVLDNCFNSVHLVQEACRRACRESGVFSPQPSTKIVAEGVDGAQKIKEIVSDQKGRYFGFMQNVSDGFQQTDKEMPKWVIYSLLKSGVAELTEGLRLREISEIIKAAHPDGQALNPGNITQILKSISSLQIQKGIRPIVIDYDNPNRVLNVVDKGFLIWFANQDREELLREVGLPTEV